MTARKKSRSDKRLVAAISDRLGASLLSGDADFTPPELETASRFVLDTAMSRTPGEVAIAVESVTGPVEQRLTRIAIVNDDMPFLVDSVAATVTAHGLTIDRLVHPTITVNRDKAGLLTDLPDPKSGGRHRESVIYVEADRADARTRVRLRAALEMTLGDIRVAVSDWPNMQEAMAADVETLERSGRDKAEGAELLRWLNDGMLTQLGYVMRWRDGRQTGALGICRNSTKTPLAAASCQRAIAWFENAERPIPLVIKSNKMSLVHRRTPLDLFIVPVMEEGRVAGLSIHAGVWTSAAMSASPEQVPRMRRQLSAIMGKLAFDPQGHDGKILTHVLTKLPHDLLIAFDDAELERIATTMMRLVDRPRPHLLLVRSPLERHLFAFVWLPRDALSTTLRLEVRDMLIEASQAPVLDWSLEMDDKLALIRFVLDIRDGSDTAAEEELNAHLNAIVRGWPQAVEAELARREEETKRAAAVAARYAEAFPLAYRSADGPAEAATDIQRLRGLPANDRPGGVSRDARLHCRAGCPPGRISLKLYQAGGALPLSDAVPMLEHFGFRVMGEVPTLLDGGALGAIHDFDVELPPGVETQDLMDRSEEIEAAVAAVLNGEAEDDRFNCLIPCDGLAAREAEWLRAGFRYLRQTGVTYSIATGVDALRNAPHVTRGLIDLFVARHDPALPGSRDEAEASAKEAIRKGLAEVSAINDDRLLRRYRALFMAVVRTNAFSPAWQDDSEAALALKIDSSAIPGLPSPVPWREVFVYSRRVEGIHLRAGPVARGGLRWSDRRDDFRTEVLGLMKAQCVKNAVIVPNGAKGGFYPKRLPDRAAHREAWAAEGKASYETFIRALLSVTDNIVDDEVVHPAGMVIRDGDDPYFVVAADKGTATFSDTANAIALEHGFWLGDAFASGGTNGYDHKAMGITARGAWISVQRHFLEMGVDVQKQAVRVVGCGDMSGDVFGNGMLLSKAITLVAAFDHRHIFIDPDPDPAKSWAERKRLFDLPRSSWDDYDKKLISKGGGVFPRSQKEIPLSVQMRHSLGINAKALDPDSLISAILKSPVDLIWFGGIGTYVKSSAENNVEVGDPANDALRVDAANLRAKVIGEGANLGITQAGRIEFALKGGRLNTDFIDNSAGVDCSDNEVNIKIALATAKRSRRISEKARVKLLGEMTDDVADIVLEDNRLQALALSIAEAGGQPALPSYIRLIETLEENGQLDRANEGLADNEVLGRRHVDGHGLTRPELAVILSSAKLALEEAMDQSDLPDDPLFADLLLESFPEAMRKKFREELLRHRLRKEIVATELSNSLINRMGLLHSYELVEEEGASAAQLVAAFAVAVRLLRMPEIWAAIEDASMPERARVLLFERAARALRLHIADVLRAGAGPATPAQLVADLEGGVRQLSDVAADLLDGETRAQSERLLAELVDSGAPRAQAAMVRHLFDLDGAVGISRLSRDSGIGAIALAEAFVDIGGRLGLDWAQGTATRMTPSDPWERLLVGGLARDFQQMRLDFLRRAASRETDPAAVVGRWADAQAAAISQFRVSLARAKAEVTVSPAILAQLASQARSLLAR